MKKSKKGKTYRYRPAPPHNTVSGVPQIVRRQSAEEEREGYYALIRQKLSAELLRRVSWINISVLLAVLLAFFLGSLLMEKPEKSEIEKRDLARFPNFSVESLSTGDFTRGIETWFSDTFPFRDAFVGLSSVIDESHGIRVDDVRLIAPFSGGEAQDLSQKPVITPPPASSSAATVSSEDGVSEDLSTEKSTASIPTPAPVVTPAPSPTPIPSVENEVVGEISNGTFVYKGMAMSLFGGLPSNGEWYAQVLNTYQQELPEVQIYNMIIPTAVEFYVPEKYRDLTQSQKGMIDHVYSCLDGKIKRVDAYSKLQEHTEEYLYFRTDHHWTGLGAYYAYTAFCEQAGFTPLQISDFETRRLENFIGTMYAQTKNDSSLLENPDYVDYYIFDQPYTCERYAPGAPYTPINWSLWGEYAQSPNSYSVFLHGDFPLMVVHTGIENGRKIMVVKESFGNAFAPFLINHYEEVYIVDQRYFELSAIDFIREHGINELIFANNVFAVCTPYHIQCIDNMRHQVFMPPQPEPEPVEEVTSSVEEKPKLRMGSRETE